jgi:signal transduction histidine kinase
VLLTRIIRSLVSNAIRYTNKGAVNVSCRREPDDLTITVQDTGVGISQDNLAKIFDEFYRVDNDPVGRNGGRGLGLAVVESSLRLLGTKVEVESEPGHGSSFSFTVPTAGQSQASASG